MSVESREAIDVVWLEGRGRNLPNQQQLATIMNFLNGFELSGSLGLSVGTGILRTSWLVTRRTSP